MDAAVTFERVTKAYKNKVILHEVSFSIPQGEICGLVGENGAGKTTIMKLIAGVSHITMGAIYLNGKNVTVGHQEERRRMGCLIEQPTLYGDMTARENLEIQRTLRGIPGKECIDEVLEAVGLQDTGKKNAGKFSLGMKQRLGIAVALLGNPELLILDEPINGLDPEKILFIRDLLKERNEDYHTTILISSHILDELSHIATQYCFLHKGKMLEQISKEELDLRCRVHIDLKTNHQNQVCALLEHHLGISQFSVNHQGIIQIFEKLDEPHKIARCVVENGFDLYGLTVKQESLENYYMNLLVRADQAEA